MLRLGGMTFVDGDKEQEAYKYLFTGFYQQDIETCNAFLTEVGVTKAIITLPMRTMFPLVTM